MPVGSRYKDPSVMRAVDLIDVYEDSHYAVVWFLPFPASSDASGGMWFACVYHHCEGPWEIVHRFLYWDGRVTTYSATCDELPPRDEHKRAAISDTDEIAEALVENGAGPLTRREVDGDGPKLLEAIAEVYEFIGVKRGQA